MDAPNQRSGEIDRRQETLGPPSGGERRITVSGRRATDAMKMACPFCGGSESAVVRSRGAIAADLVRRRRECADCGGRFPTTEAVDLDTLNREQAERQRGRLKFHAVVPPGSQN